MIRANFNDARVTTQNYWSFFVQDTWRVGERLTINPGLRYEEQTLVGNLTGLTTLQGNTIDEFALKGNWAPRVGAVYDVLGNGRSRLYGNYGRFFARIPNDLAARALSSTPASPVATISMPTSRSRSRMACWPGGRPTTT